MDIGKIERVSEIAQRVIVISDALLKIQKMIEREKRSTVPGTINIDIDDVPQFYTGFRVCFATEHINMCNFLSLIEKEFITKIEDLEKQLAEL